MIARLPFLVIAAFWVTMNVLLWRMEFGSHGGDMPVPLQLVWRKILTAPDASSLSVYQNGERTGYCELSTSVGQQMATLDENKPPPESFATRTGYQLHLAGNISLGDFTNRLKFDGRIQFSLKRTWEEITLKITSHLATVEIHSLATNQLVHVRVIGDNEAMERDLPFADLDNPSALIRAFTGNFADALLGTMDLPDFMSDSTGAENPVGFAPDPHQDRRRIRAGLPAGNQHAGPPDLGGCQHARRNFARPNARQCHRHH